MMLFQPAPARSGLRTAALSSRSRSSPRSRCRRSRRCRPSQGSRDAAGRCSAAPAAWSERSGSTRPHCCRRRRPTRCRSRTRTRVAASTSATSTTVTGRPLRCACSPGWAWSTSWIRGSWTVSRLPAGVVTRGRPASPGCMWLWVAVRPLPAWRVAHPHLLGPAAVEGLLVAAKSLVSLLPGDERGRRPCCEAAILLTLALMLLVAALQPSRMGRRPRGSGRFPAR